MNNIRIDPEYGVLNMTVIGDNIATVGDVLKKDTNPKARAFIDAFNLNSNRSRPLL